MTILYLLLPYFAVFLGGKLLFFRWRKSLSQARDFIFFLISKQWQKKERSYLLSMNGKKKKRNGRNWKVFSKFLTWLGCYHQKYQEKIIMLNSNTKYLFERQEVFFCIQNTVMKHQNRSVFIVRITLRFRGIIDVVLQQIFLHFL